MSSIAETFCSSSYFVSEETPILLDGCTTEVKMSGNDSITYLNSIRFYCFYATSDKIMEVISAAPLYGVHNTDYIRTRSTAKVRSNKKVTPKLPVFTSHFSLLTFFIFHFFSFYFYGYVILPPLLSDWFDIFGLDVRPKKNDCSTFIFS